MPKKAVSFVELGCATGFVTFGISKLYSINGTGVDFKTELSDSFYEGRKLNGLEEKVEFLGCDIGELKNHIPVSSQDMVVFNPPHYEENRGKEYSDTQRCMARSFDGSMYECYSGTVNYLLKNRGHFYMVISPINMYEWITELGKYRLIVKNIKPVYGKAGNAQLLLMHGIKNANSGFLKFETPVFLTHQSR